MNRNELINLFGNDLSMYMAAIKMNENSKIKENHVYLYMDKIVTTLN